MKQYLTSFITFFALNAFSQGGTWTWISGDSTSNAAGVYGIQGVPSVANHPAAGYECEEWKDKQGNFWIYGSTFSQKSDLWKYNSATNEWTWVKGSGLSGQPPVYGSLGIPQPNNSPGPRGWGTVTWVDTSGNLWLFGGAVYKNDLWRYDIGTNDWTWMGGDTVQNAIGNHGIQGIPGVTNIPGSRIESSSAWTDSLNNLWLFGGMGFGDAANSGNLNDLMKYNVGTNEWTWMHGSDSVNAANSYGIKGIPASTNTPGGRMSYAKWQDLDHNFWIMGGGEVWTSRYYNDMWKYEPGTNEWTWMAGPNTWNNDGMYQANCVFDSINMPVARAEHRSNVVDRCGRFWLFGGGATSLGGGVRNDLWAFDPLILRWNWLSGTNIPNAPGSSGSIGIPASTNIPSARCGSVAWWGNDNNFYLFGGYKLGDSYGDLWIFTPDSNCLSNCTTPALFTSFVSDSNELCPGTCTDFTSVCLNATAYQWSFQGAFPDTSTAVNPTNICYPNPGSYDVQLIAYNATVSDTLLLSNYITVYPSPLPQSIIQSGDTLLANTGATSYQWYFNGSLVTGATDYYYVAPTGGDYNVVAADENGCEVEAVIFNVIAYAQSTVQSLQSTVFPNPVEESLFVSSYLLSGTAVEISVYNALGDKMMAASCGPMTVDCRLLLPGIYFIEISSHQGTYRTKFIKR
jgi:hypothetical protein